MRTLESKVAAIIEAFLADCLPKVELIPGDSGGMSLGTDRALGTYSLQFEHSFQDLAQIRTIQTQQGIRVEVTVPGRQPILKEMMTTETGIKYGFQAKFDAVITNLIQEHISQRT